MSNGQKIAAKNILDLFATGLSRSFSLIDHGEIFENKKSAMYTRINIHTSLEPQRRYSNISETRSAIKRQAMVVTRILSIHKRLLPKLIIRTSSEDISPTMIYLRRLDIVTLTGLSSPVLGIN